MMYSRYISSQLKNNSIFLAGVIIGVWIALVAIPLQDEDVCDTIEVPTTSPDEFEPHIEQKASADAAPAQARAITRPRYYTTELGIKGAVLGGVLTGESAIGANGRATALNHTASYLQPALRLFITASSLHGAPPLPNVVGFTDTREMLKPFHALKYLADNYLEEYNFFFLVSDAAYINTRRLQTLVSRLSVSQDVYMGVAADDDTQYCSLDAGILISNSVLNAVHRELDWCVRNSYSPHHHENIGRCIIHAANVACTDSLQGEKYLSFHIPESESISSIYTQDLTESVTIHPIPEAKDYYTTHAYVSRMFLERYKYDISEARASMYESSKRHPTFYRNSTWPGGLRNDPGMLAPTPENRFDYIRWTYFNQTHTLFPNDKTTVSKLSGAHKKAIDIIVSTAQQWGAKKWVTTDVGLVEGAYKWEPALGLHYKLLMTAGEQLRQLEVWRPLGQAVLVPTPYVTESSRVILILVFAVTHSIEELDEFMDRYQRICLDRDKNTDLVVVLQADWAYGPDSLELERKIRTKGGRVVRGDGVKSAFGGLSRDSLLLLADIHMEYSEEFLNRVRMNSVAGVQWYWPIPFSRYAQYEHPLFREPDGSKPRLNTGHFIHRYENDVHSFYKKDYDNALTTYRASKGRLTDPSPLDVLTSSGLRCIRSPEPALIKPPPRVPCPDFELECLEKLNPEDLPLGSPNELAKLLLSYNDTLAQINV